MKTNDCRGQKRCIEKKKNILIEKKKNGKGQTYLKKEQGKYLEKEISCSRKGRRA